MNDVQSPLLPESKAQLIEALNSAEIKSRWKESFGIKLDGIWEEDFDLLRYRCEQSGLMFFVPTEAAGSERLYSELQKIPWYYMEEKWEHRMALKDIKAGSRVLEVGCGQGGFIASLKSAGHDAVGIEMNPAAVRKALDLGRNARHAMLGDVARIEPEAFDVVCHFEVLEHVTDISGFLDECIACLKPGGKLLFALPNMSSFVGEIQGSLMNAPPHHMSQWTPEAVAFLESIFPLRLLHQRFEPLASYHIDWYLGHKHSQNTARPRLVRGVVSRFLRIGAYLLKYPAFRSAITGHTQYACFEKR